MVENIRKEKRYEVSEEQLQLFIFKVTYLPKYEVAINNGCCRYILFDKENQALSCIVDGIFVWPADKQQSGRKLATTQFPIKL